MKFSKSNCERSRHAPIKTGWERVATMIRTRQPLLQLTHFSRKILHSNPFPINNWNREQINTIACWKTGEYFQGQAQNKSSGRSIITSSVYNHGTRMKLFSLFIALVQARFIDEAGMPLTEGDHETLQDQHHKQCRVCKFVESPNYPRYECKYVDC